MESEVLDMVEIRVKILKELVKSPKKVKNIYWAVDSNWHNVNYHLKRMQDMKLVDKDGKNKAWFLTEKGKQVYEVYT